MIGVICMIRMIWLMLPGGSRILCMIYEWHMLPGLDLPYKADPAQRITAAEVRI